MPDIATRADLELLLRHFYGRAFADPVLEPVFETLMVIGLDDHLPVMCDFWETILLRTGVYRGSSVPCTGRCTAGTDSPTGTSTAGSSCGRPASTSCSSATSRSRPRSRRPGSQSGCGDGCSSPPVVRRPECPPGSADW